MSPATDARRFSCGDCGHRFGGDEALVLAGGTILCPKCEREHVAEEPG